MAPLACLLQELGHKVRGVDGPLYPPMSTLLSTAGIEPLVGYDEAHLRGDSASGQPDLVIVGNAVHRSNPEAVKAEEEGLERISMPQAVARFLLRGRQSLVVSGTHGKTTTTTLAAWVYDQCGREPGYLIGGVPRNLQASFHLGSGKRFVIEGDEYNAAYFDRGPKFLHYRPESAILTSVEYDHADLYPDPATLLRSYESLVRLLPAEGFLAAWGDSSQVRSVASNAACPVVFYGMSETNEVHPRGGVAGVQEGPHGSRCELPGRHGWREVQVLAPGRHNLLNAMAVWAVARRDGLPEDEVVGALATFSGAKRRLEELGDHGGVIVVDDFAHHPTAVKASIAGLKSRYPDRRRVILFEPRSLTAGRRMFQQAYSEAFAEAHRVLLAPIFHAARFEQEDLVDLQQLVMDLESQGVSAHQCSDVEEVFRRALDEAQPEDVVATMSSGAFGGMPHRLVAELRDRQHRNGEASEESTGTGPDQRD